MSRLSAGNGRISAQVAELPQIRNGVGAVRKPKALRAEKGRAPDPVPRSVCVRDPEQAALPEDKHKPHRGTWGAEPTQHRACYVTVLESSVHAGSAHATPQVVPSRAFLSSHSARRLQMAASRQRKPTGFLNAISPAPRRHGLRRGRGRESGAPCVNADPELAGKAVSASKCPKRV